MKRRKWLSWILAPIGLLIWPRKAKPVTPQPNNRISVYNERPSQNTTTGVLTLLNAPNPPLTLRLCINGLRHTPVEDYNLSGAAATPVAANVALYASATVLVADYDR